MKKPAFAKKINLELPSGARSEAWVFVGSWAQAKNLSAMGFRNVLCVPPGENPLLFDWSILRGAHIVVWAYGQIDVRKFIATLRAAGALDISIFDPVKGIFLALALSAQSEKLLAEVRAVATA